MNKSKLILISLILIITVSFIAVISFFYTNNQALGVKKYSANHLSFNYPQAWHIDKSVEKLTTNLIVSNNNKAQKLLIEVRELPISYSSYSLKQINDVVKVRLKNEFKNWKEIDEETTTVGKKSYKSIATSFSDGDSRYSELQVINHRNLLIVIVINDDAKSFDATLFECDLIIDSLEIAD